MNRILQPLDVAGNIGFDEFNQLILRIPHPTEKDWYTMRPSPDLREQRCSICGRGWELNAESWDDHWWWSAYQESVHESCFVRYCSLRDRETFRRHFIDARLRFECLEPIFNQYHTAGRWSARPWYKIALLDHPVDFILGLRKRVVEIQVAPREGQLEWWATADAAFGGEDVTKGFGPEKIYVHAWTEEKERQYIEWLAKAGSLQIQREG